MRLNIEFSGRAPRPQAADLLLFVIGVAAAVAATWEATEVYTAHRMATQALAGARLVAKRETFTLSAKQIEAVNRTVRQLNLPWQSLLAAVEDQLTDQVALLSLEPEASTRLLRLQAEAKSADDMVDFVEALASDKRFVSARLTRHEINEGDRNRPFRFTLEAEWAADL